MNKKTWFTEQLDKAADDVKDWPDWVKKEAGLTTDAPPLLQCSRCGRKSVDATKGGLCNMTQPSGNRCQGRFG